MSNSEYLDSLELEALTGTKASTWRYWASIGEGPASFKLGRRRVWKRSTVLAWIAEQERAAV
jgi:prophage regulatory protein